MGAGQAVAEPGTLLRGDSQPGKGKNALTFFREVNKVRECGWDPVYLTPAPWGTGSHCKTTYWDRTSQTSGAMGPSGRPGEGEGHWLQPRPQTPFMRAAGHQRRHWESNHSLLGESCDFKQVT